MIAFQWYAGKDHDVEVPSIWGSRRVYNLSPTTEKQIKTVHYKKTKQKYLCGYFKQ